MLNAWNALPGRGWPLTGPEEGDVVADLESRARRARRRPGRADVTMLMLMLRDGVTVDEALEVLPGLGPDSLLDAHTHLTRLLDRASGSWREIVDRPSAITLTSHAQWASRILPVPVRRLTEVAVQWGSVASIDVAAHAADHHVRALQQGSLVVEERLTDPRLSSSAKSHLGRSLMHPFQECLWGEPYYLPTRVGALSPSRLACLLNERPAGRR